LKYHTVKPGEYPGVIARLYGVSVGELLKLNGLDKNSVIKAGDRLAIAGEMPASKEVADNKDDQAEAAPAPAAASRHKVAKGETPGKIAAHYGVKTQDLLSWNNLTAKSIIRVGQELTVRSSSKSTAKRDTSNDVTLAQSQTNNRVVHKVTAGQNPTSIAKKYGVSVNDLFKWNNWKDKHVLKVGDEVEIYRD